MSVFPSADDDVVTSPYNALLSASKLISGADCVFPLENAALLDVCDLISKRSDKAPVKSGSALSGVDGGGPTKAKEGGKPFDGMNGLAANLMLNLTAGMRFGGALNVDLNEITMNLVPFPKMHFLQASMAPLIASADLARLAPGAKGVDQLFTQVPFVNYFSFCTPPPLRIPPLFVLYFLN